MSSVQQALPGTASLQRSASGQVGRELDRMLAGLNGPQRQAVVHEGSPLLIVAGAGRLVAQDLGEAALPGSVARIRRHDGSGLDGFELFAVAEKLE